MQVTERTTGRQRGVQNCRQAVWLDCGGSLLIGSKKADEEEKRG